MTRPKPLVLCILDGWGHREETENNAIAQAHTPHWDRFMATYPHSLIEASAEDVGLPEGQMGNSEVGHMNIGAGRVVMQDLPRIDAAIASGELAANPRLQRFVSALQRSGGVCHLLGLLSPGGVHSHQDHLLALAKIIAAAGVPVKIHAFLDGRDTPPQSAAEYMRVFEDNLSQWERSASDSKPGEGSDSAMCYVLCAEEVAAKHKAQSTKHISDTHPIRIATVCGRYYAMDRDKRWERVEKAWRALARAEGEKAADAAAAIARSYAKGVTDEFMLPAVIGDYGGMQDGDGLLMGNFRADRAREILHALLDESFEAFARSSHIRFVDQLGLVEYSAALAAKMDALFPPESLSNGLGELISQAGMKQLRIAETEKYAHVTFFFNGGSEAEYPGEDRILIPSPKVATYDLKPEMSAYEVTDALVKAIAGNKYDLIVVNYANTDMVGHSGDLAAAVKAVEAVDRCLGRLSEAVLKAGGALLITADHGNAEQMTDPDTTQPHTAHTLCKVPLLLIGKGFEGKKLADGRLADIAPTCLAVLEMAQPGEMTGRSLLE